MAGSTAEEPLPDLAVGRRLDAPETMGVMPLAEALSCCVANFPEPVTTGRILESEAPLTTGMILELELLVVGNLELEVELPTAGSLALELLSTGNFAPE